MLYLILIIYICSIKKRSRGLLETSLGPGEPPLAGDSSGSRIAVYDGQTVPQASSKGDGGIDDHR